jgi:hypothetical protein
MLPDGLRAGRARARADASQGAQPEGMIAATPGLHPSGSSPLLADSTPRSRGLQLAAIAITGPYSFRSSTGVADGAAHSISSSAPKAQLASLRLRSPLLEIAARR